MKNEDIYCIKFNFDVDFDSDCLFEDSFIMEIFKNQMCKSFSKCIILKCDIDEILIVIKEVDKREILKEIKIILNEKIEYTKGKDIAQIEIKEGYPPRTW